MRKQVARPPKQSLPADLTGHYKNAEGARVTIQRNETDYKILLTPADRPFSTQAITVTAEGSAEYVQHLLDSGFWKAERQPYPRVYETYHLTSAQYQHWLSKNNRHLTVIGKPPAGFHGLIVIDALTLAEGFHPVYWLVAVREISGDGEALYDGISLKPVEELIKDQHVVKGEWAPR